jgi:Helix-turn-helix domain
LNRVVDGSSDGRTIGETIMRLRVRSGLSRVQLSGLIGKSPSWLYKVERGDLIPDRLAVLAELARVLRVDLGELAGRPVPAPLMSAMARPRAAVDARGAPGAGPSQPTTRPAAPTPAVSAAEEARTAVLEPPPAAPEAAVATVPEGAEAPPAAPGAAVAAGAEPAEPPAAAEVAPVAVPEPAEPPSAVRDTVPVRMVEPPPSPPEVLDVRQPVTWRRRGALTSGALLALAVAGVAMTVMAPSATPGGRSGSPAEARTQPNPVLPVDSRDTPSPAPTPSDTPPAMPESTSVAAVIPPRRAARGAVTASSGVVGAAAPPPPAAAPATPARTPAPAPWWWPWGSSPWAGGGGGGCGGAAGGCASSASCSHTAVARDTGSIPRGGTWRLRLTVGSGSTLCVRWDNPGVVGTVVGPDGTARTGRGGSWLVAVDGPGTYTLELRLVDGTSPDHTYLMAVD